MPTFKIEVNGKRVTVEAPNKEALPEIVDTISSGQKPEVRPGDERKPIPFSTKEKTGLQKLLPATGGDVQNVLSVLQREEAVATETIRAVAGKGDFGRIRKAASGKLASQLGDIARESGASEGKAKVLGFGASLLLPSNLAGGKIFKSMGKARRAVRPGRVARVGAVVTGIDQDVLEQTAQRGYRNVLRKKFFKKEVPVQLQEVIESNMDILRDSARFKFDETTAQLRGIPVDRDAIITKIKGNLKFNKDGRVIVGRKLKEVDSLADELVGAIDNVEVNNLGDLLDIRRDIDDKIFTEKGLQKRGTEGAKKVRDILRDILHENKGIKDADELWTNLEGMMDTIVDKLTKDFTGENVLRRFATLPKKAKNLISELEVSMRKQNPAVAPFVEELTNFSLAQEFLPRSGRATLNRGGMLERIALPFLRGMLRTGPIIQTGKGKLAQAVQKSGVQAGRKLTESLRDTL